MGAKYQVKRPMTAREAAGKFGTSPRTVRAYIALPREQWLAEHTLARSEPWRALGISRATWYRRGKPMPAAGGAGGQREA